MPFPTLAEPVGALLAELDDNVPRAHVAQSASGPPCVLWVRHLDPGEGLCLRLVGRDEVNQPRQPDFGRGASGGPGVQDGAHAPGARIECHRAGDLERDFQRHEDRIRLLEELPSNGDILFR